MAPAAFHQIAERGDDTPRLHGAVSWLVRLARLPFALGFALDFYVALARLHGHAAGVAWPLAARHRPRTMTARRAA